MYAMYVCVAPVGVAPAQSVGNLPGPPPPARASRRVPAARARAARGGGGGRQTQRRHSPSQAAFMIQRREVHPERYGIMAGYMNELDATPSATLCVHISCRHVCGLWHCIVYRRRRCADLAAAAGGGAPSRRVSYCAVLARLVKTLSKNFSQLGGAWAARRRDPCPAIDGHHGHHGHPSGETLKKNSRS